MTENLTKTIMDERKAFSFGFSKKVNNKPLEKSKLHEENEKANDQDPDFITSLEDREVKGSSKPKEPKEKKYVIPLITQNNWRKPVKDKDGTDKTDKPEPTGDGMESQAVQELIEDAARQNEGWDDRGKMDPNLAIPLIMMNKVPEGYETDDRLDVALRPDENDVNYDEIPIEHFGVAMLRGMGWKDGEGIGKNKQTIAPVDAQLRPKGLGLGADRSKATQLNGSKTGETGQGEDDQLLLKTGAYCVVQRGPHQNRYGVIEGLDEDNARCMVKLAVSGLMITQSQHSIRLVDKKEYSKYSKYLNKQKVDKYKEEQEKKSDRHEKDHHKHKKDRRDRHEQRHHGDRRGDDERRERHSDRDDERRDRHSDRDGDERRDRKDRDQGLDTDRIHERLQGEDRRSEKKRDREDRDHKDRSDSKKKRHQEKRSSSPDQISNGHSRSSQASLWICSQLRVRIVDDKFKNGKYFNTKVEVIDVLSADNSVCRTDDGRVLEGLSQEMLETVIPKSEPSFVKVVTGKYKGQLAEMMKRDKSSCKAVVQLLRDRDEVVKLDYDSMCEYVGDINAEFDY